MPGPYGPGSPYPGGSASPPQAHHSSGGGRAAGKSQKRQERRRRKKESAKKGDDCGCGHGHSPEDEDRAHFADVCYAFLSYQEDAECELRWFEEGLEHCTMDPHDRILWGPAERADKKQLMVQMQQRVVMNARFLALLVHSDEEAQDFTRIPKGHDVQERNASKVRIVLRQFVRDWADEGQIERDSQYKPLLDALKRFLPLDSPGRPQYRVVCPGSGLGRLPFEAAVMGYSAQGNEFSYQMLQGSKWVLNETQDTRTHTIFPYVLSTSNAKLAADNLRGVQIPDICPVHLLCPGGRPGPQEFSMCAGEFVEVYQGQVEEWDAVLTCFFVDTAKNIFLYIRTIANIIRPGGIWSNLGPLLYHYAEQPDAISIELSWEEVRPAIAKYFDFKEEDRSKAYYSTNIKEMSHTIYNTIYFTAVRNDNPVQGMSNPVF